MSAEICVEAIGVAVTAAGVYVAWKGLFYLGDQVKKAADANKTGNLMLVLTLEQGVINARVELARASKEALDLTSQQAPQKFIDSANMFLEERVENYLNSLDRLCACIVRGYVDDIEYRQDYRDTLKETIAKHPTRFDAATRHRNIIKLHSAWADDLHVSKKAIG
jgi:hypothetical protein